MLIQVFNEDATQSITYTPAELRRLAQQAAREWHGRLADCSLQVREGGRPSLAVRLTSGTTIGVAIDPPVGSRTHEEPAERAS